MRMNRMLGAAVVAMSVTAAAGAQSMKTMGMPSKGDTTSKTYAGCVESVNHGAAFLLTKVEGTGSMDGDMAMKHHDDMAMKHDDTAMKGDAAESFVLAGSTDLGKHVGEKVSVTGSLTDGSMGTMSLDLSTLTIKTLKVIAKSCS
jgi:hypothetical protein